MLAARINKMQPAITVLTHACSDIRHPSLMLQTKDGRRYIFGEIGEGFQRSLVQHKTKSTKLTGIFLTGTIRWSQMSGLPGYLLSLAEVHRVSEIHSALHEKTQRMIASWKNFTFHTPLNLDTASPNGFQDENVAIESVILGENSLPSTSYILQILPVRGKFMVAKARALGVPSGALFGKLSNGETVTTPDGKIVQPHEVLGPSPTPCRVLILDLPTESHVKEVLTHSWEARLKRKREEDNEYEVSISAIYYFLSNEVDVNSSALAEIAAAYPSAKHVVSHPATSPDFMTLQRLKELQTALREIIPDHIPRVYENGPEMSLPEPFVPLKQNDIMGLTAHDAVELVSEPLKSSAPATPSIKFSDNEPTVVTLGTGSSAPSNFRNVSSSMVRVPTSSGARGILFDCGEGTLNTLKRIYGPTGLQDRLKEIDTVYISHMHADHHLGLLTFIRHWHQTNSGTLNLLGPAAIFKFVLAWESIDSGEVDVNRLNFVDLEDVIQGSGFSSRSPMDEDSQVALFERLGFSVRTCRAIHCDRSYSAVFDYDLPDGSTFRVAYSGDTRPNSYFARLAADSDVLVHEATHEDELQEDAISKRHSTISEALSIAAQMRARNIILTHFSQRYPRLPDVRGLKIPAPACFAFDSLHAPLSKIKELFEATNSVARAVAALESDDDQ